MMTNLPISWRSTIGKLGTFAQEMIRNLFPEAGCY